MKRTTTDTLDIDIPLSGIALDKGNSPLVAVPKKLQPVMPEEEGGNTFIQKRLEDIQKRYYGKLRVDPIDFLAHLMMGNVEPLRPEGVSEGDMEMPTLRLRLDAAKELGSYLYPKLKSIEMRVDANVQQTVDQTQRTLAEVVHIIGSLGEMKARIVEGESPQPAKVTHVDP